MNLMDWTSSWLIGDRLLIGLVRALCLVLALLLGGALLPAELALLDLLARPCAL